MTATVRKSCIFITLLLPTMSRRFYYYDATPKGQSNANNCVTRAIKLGTGLPYETIQRLLTLTAKEHHCNKLTCDCYSYLLEDIFGYEYFDCGYEYTVQEIADMFYDDIVIMRLDGHLTASAFGISIDTFDCTDELVDCFWVVERG